MPFESAAERSVVSRHGSLSVKGNQIVDSLGEPIALAGTSFFWSNSPWEGAAFYEPEVVGYLKDGWGVTWVRAALGVEGEGGYIEEPEANLERVQRVLDAAIRAGIYVVVDWHSHRAEDYETEAVEFFGKIARTYGHQANLIYEIYNEPIESDWQTQIKPYAETVIGAIRQWDRDNLIVVGTPQWSQDVDVASADPITGYDNIAYSLHFYAGSHGEELREKARVAMRNGIALMVTEWGTVSADGTGPVNYESTEAWFAFMRQHGISHANWSICNKPEGASAFLPDTSPEGPWTSEDLTESGRFVRELIRGWNGWNE